MDSFNVNSADSGKRTDVFVAEKYPDFSRSSLKTLFKQKLVEVNAQPEEPGDKLKAGDIVSVKASALLAEPKKLNLPIVYEDDDIIVVDKPAGILTHSKGALNTESTFASFLKPYITDKSLAGNRAGIVHRLDRQTSGVIVGAKNSAALKELQKQFSSRKVGKSYMAVVEGRPEPSSALIDAPILRNPAQPQTFKVGVGGKTAQTEYSTVRNFEKNGQAYSLLKLKPTTGRTHQLRVHLAYINHPVVGDMVYGPKDQAGNLMLHAASLELKLPSGKTMKFEAPQPQAFQESIS